MKVKVKIDGLTNLNDINMVIEEGVDLIGFITGFPELHFRSINIFSLPSSFVIL